MQLDSPFIEEVSRGWYDHVVAWAKHPPDADKALYNGYIPHVVLAGLNDAVVPPHAATIQGMPLTHIDGDHSQVIQPIDRNDTRYKVWSMQVQEIVSHIAPLRFKLSANLSCNKKQDIVSPVSSLGRGQRVA